MRYKICKRCDRDFATESTNAKYCSPACRQKADAAAKSAYRARPSTKKKARENAERWRTENYLDYRLACLKSKSKQLGLAFDLELSDLVVPEFCPALGIPLDGRDAAHTWSVDRLIPLEGYVKGNIRIISMEANRIKNNASLEQLENIVKWLKSEMA